MKKKNALLIDLRNAAEPQRLATIGCVVKNGQ